MGSPPHDQVVDAKHHHLGSDETVAAFEALAPDEKLKLDAIETTFLWKTGFQPRELLREALLRTMDGTRRCPRNVPIMAFVVETMRSIAYHERGKRSRVVSIDEAPSSERTQVSQLALASDQPTPEEHLVEKEAPDIVATFHWLFEGDEPARMLLLGWADELRGQDLQDFVGAADQAALDYLAKRVRRVIRKKFPKGWTS